MLNETVARRYAAAVFALASESGAVETIGRDLVSAKRTLCDDEEIRRFFVSPVVDRKQKASIVDRACVSYEAIARNLLQLLVKKRREALLGAIVLEYEKLALAARGRRALEIVSARSLPDDELSALVGRLRRKYGGEFEVVARVDPALLGGVRVALGDLRIDASVSGRLEQLARELASSSLQGTRV